MQREKGQRANDVSDTNVKIATKNVKGLSDKYSLSRLKYGQIAVAQSKFISFSAVQNVNNYYLHPSLLKCTRFTF